MMLRSVKDMEAENELSERNMVSECNTVGELHWLLCSNNRREGPACSRCPKNFALESSGVCEECPDLEPEETLRWRILFCCAAGVAILFVWVLLSW